MSYRSRRRSHWGYSRYVPVAERRAKAARLAAKLRKQGRVLSPVEIEGRTIARTFWGKAWCTNLESYSDYRNRLPRGRTYARNGSVIDLQITEGRVTAMVSGSEVYDVTVEIDTLPRTRWERVRADSAGQIDSLVELLQGRLSDGVMEVVTRRGTGLFPAPREIHLSCSCPDWATMCKHVAAVLYGVGNRLDQDPGLLFSLRGVDPAEMVEEAIDQGVATGPATGPTLDEDDLSAVFGVDFDLGDDEEPEPESGAPWTVYDFEVLARLTEQPESTVDEIAEWMDRAPETVRSAIEGLCEQDLVEGVGASRSGRFRRIVPSPQTHPVDGLGAQDLWVLATVGEQPGIKTTALADWLGVPVSSVRKALTRLRKDGWVEFVGAKRTGGWRWA